GADGPDLMKLEDLLEEWLVYFEAAFPERSDADPIPDPIRSPASAESSLDRPAGRGAAEALGGREAAYRRLREVAAYLKKIEPHSPVPFLIERAIQWGEMPFDRLFKDVVKNPDVQRHVWETLGIEELEDNSSS